MKHMVVQSLYICVHAGSQSDVPSGLGTTRLNLSGFLLVSASFAWPPLPLPFLQPLDGFNSRLIPLCLGGSQGGQGWTPWPKKSWHTQTRKHMCDFSGYWHERHTRQRVKNLATRKTRLLGLLRWVWLFIVFKVIWKGVEMYPLNEDENWGSEHGHGLVLPPDSDGSHRTCGNSTIGKIPKQDFEFWRTCFFKPVYVLQVACSLQGKLWQT